MLKRTKCKGISLANKLILTAFAVLLIVYAVLSAIVFAMDSDRKQQKFIDDARGLCAQGNQQIENGCTYLLGISDYLELSPAVQEFLQYARIGGVERALDNSVIYGLSSIKYPVSAVVFDLNGTPVDWMSIDGSSSPQRQDILADTPFTRVVMGNSSYEWEFIAGGSSHLFAADNSPKLCLWKVIRNSATTQPMGVMALSVDTRRFIRINAENDLYHKLIQFDLKTGQVACNHSRFVLTEGMIVDLIRISGEPEGYDQIAFNGQSYSAFCSRVRSTTLVTCYIATPPTFWTSFQEYSTSYLLLATSILVAMIVLLYCAFRWFTKPLQRLTASVEAYTQGDMDVPFDYRADDEIGKLSQAFNKLSEVNRNMIEHTIELKMREQEAELTALQAQIDPHFLYNMLNLIYWKAEHAGNGELSEIAYSMGQLFRMMLKRGRSMITLREELETCRNYLLLQKKRYGDHIEYEIHCRDDALLEQCIPHLLLQPLVENAVVHGAETFSGSVHIQVTAEKEEDLLILRVENDGEPIPPEILALLPDRMPRDTERPGNHCALRNLSDRLRLLYGEHGYRFTFRSDEDDGTVVTVVLPLEGKQKQTEEVHSNA